MVRLRPEPRWIEAVLGGAGVMLLVMGLTGLGSAIRYIPRPVTIDFTGPAQMAFANYWQSLISAGDINHTADFSPIFWKNLDSGVDASWLSAATVGLPRPFSRLAM